METIDAGSDQTLPSEKADHATLIGEQVGATIGHYKLLQQLGEGGFGTVFMAEQRHPVRRTVALKIIKLGMDTKQVVARFEAERQALAMMDHPGIAKVLDAGATQTGRPYFVMELVRGVPITLYCDTNKLPVRERLDLFVQVCQAVQHAHQKGIIHRDIKPSNVLVAMADGKPVPKVIDFGIAKATDQRLTDKTVVTEFRQMIGTPQYMSPEQAEMAGIDIDTRSDVYSLGVLLYELLVGTPPFLSTDLSGKSYEQIQKMIREVDPPRPSTRLSSAADTLGTVADRRRIEPSRLGQILRGELDWIVLRAMEKDRTRRYATAIALSEDVQRYLDGDAVEACPPSRTYRFKKVLRRHRVVFLAGAAVAGALVLGVIGTSIGMMRAREARNDEAKARSTAQENERQANLKTELANKRLAQIKTANDVLATVFTDLNPRQSAKQTLPLAAVLALRLEHAAQRLDAESIGDPLVVARMQERLGDAMLQLGHPDKARPVLEKARQTYLAHYGLKNENTLGVMGTLAWTWLDSDPQKTIAQAEEVWKLRREVLGEDHPNTSVTIAQLAEAYQRAGQPERALELTKQALEHDRRNLGENHGNTASAMVNLASHYLQLGRATEAVPMLEEALKVARVQRGERHPDTLHTIAMLGSCYCDVGRVDEGIALLKQAVEQYRSVLGPTHPDTITWIGSLAGKYSRANRIEDALPLAEEALRQSRLILGEEHRATLDNIGLLANIYRKNGEPERALPMLEESLRLRRKRLGNDHPETLVAFNDVGVAYWSLKRLDKSVPLFEEALKLLEAKHGKDHPNVLRTRANLGVNYMDAGRINEAIPLLESVVQASRTVPALTIVRTRLADCYIRAGRFDDAKQQVLAWLEFTRKSLPANSAYLIAPLEQGATLLGEANALEEAAEVLRERLALSQVHESAALQALARAALGAALLKQRNFDEAEEHLVAALEAMPRRSREIDADSRVKVVRRLIELYSAQNKAEDVAYWKAKLEEELAATRPATQRAQPPGGE